MDDIEYECPVCHVTHKSNMEKTPFGNASSVAFHIASKILTGCRQHLSWAYSQFDREQVDKTKEKAKKTNKNNILANLFEWKIKEWHDKKSKNIKEKESSEEPNVLAYKYIQQFETQFHQFIRQILEREYGEDEKGWWVKGIPPKIRIECVKRREDDPLREEPYSYTDLIDLKDIIDKNWRLFQSELELVQGYSSTKKELLEAIERLNEIRRRVMHPIRLKVTEDDIAFLKGFYNLVEEQISKSSMVAANWDKVLIEIHKSKNYLTPVVTDSFSWFYSEGLFDLIMDKFPMIPKSRRLELSFVSIEFREPELDEESSLALSMTFACPLYVTTRLLIKETCEIKEQCLYFGDIPFITKKGTFIIDGKEKFFNDESIKSHSLENSTLNAALTSIKDIAIKRMGRVSLETVTPSGLIDTSLFINAVNAYFGSQK